MDPYAGHEIQATTTCIADNGTFCTQYTTVVPSFVIGDIVFSIGILVFFGGIIFLGYFFGTFAKNSRP